MGKSRLVAELFAYHGAKPELTRWRQGRCLPYGEGITFWALGEIVKAEAGDPRVRLGGGGGGEAGGGGLRRRSPSGSGCFSGWRRWSASRRPRRRSGRSLSRPGGAYLEGLAAARADGARVRGSALGRRGAARVPGAPGRVGRRGAAARSLHGAAGAVRAAARAGRAGAKRDDDQPPPLSDQETAELVSHLVTTTVLSHELRAGRCSSGRAATRSTRRSSCACSPTAASSGGRCLAEAELPESLQALIAARLDTLSPERKSLLQDAAVLGKVFWVGRAGRDRRP